MNYVDFPPGLGLLHVESLGAHKLMSSVHLNPEAVFDSVDREML